MRTRPPGTTLRRPDPLGRRVARALYDPHDARERFDPDFMMGLQCQACGRVGAAARRDVSAAVADHAETCPRRHVVDSVAVRVYYPKQ